MTIYLHKGDLPADVAFHGSVAVDTETLGLNPHRDRLCLVQLSAGNGDAHLVQLPAGGYAAATNLKALLGNPNVLKIFHFARFDVAVIRQYLDVDCAPIYCTKIASKLTRTYTDKHGLKELCKDVLGVELNKQQQSSDWGAAQISEDQKNYAASDVLYLHDLKKHFDVLLEREGRADIAKACFDFMTTRARLDLLGWTAPDIFEH